MMTVIKLINISVNSQSYFICVVRIREIYPLRKFQVHNTVFLTMVTLLT